MVLYQREDDRAYPLFEAALEQILGEKNWRGAETSEPPNRSLLWWVIPGVLAGIPMPFVHPEPRLNLGGSLNADEDELPELYAAERHRA